MSVRQKHSSARVLNVRMTVAMLLGIISNFDCYSKISTDSPITQSVSFKFLLKFKATQMFLEPF